MNLISLYYFIEVTKDQQITTTANRLHISQQTLSNHISGIEKHYGLKLFYRRPRLQLTPAGRDVLHFAEQVYQSEINLKGILADTIESDSGEITLGARSPRCNYYLPDVLKKFSEKYPNVKINLIENTNEELEKLIQKNYLDFAVILNSGVSRSGVNISSTHADPVYFCVSDKLLYRHYGDEMAALKEKSGQGAHMADFSKLPFMMLSTQNRLGRLVNDCFLEAGYIPHSYLNATYATIMLPLCNAALAAGFTSHMNLSQSTVAEDVNIFPLLCGAELVQLTLEVIYNKQRYLNHHCRYFLDLLDKQFSIIEKKNLARISLSK